jgi:threonine dehydratase
VAGTALVAKTLKLRSMRIIGVQAEAAPAAWISWRERRIATSTTATAAEGLATRVGFEMPQQIMRELLDDFILVSEEELRAATRLMIEKTRNLVEPSRAAPLAAALRLRDQLAGKQVALMCSGGNISPAQLVEILK